MSLRISVEPKSDSAWCMELAGQMDHDSAGEFEGYAQDLLLHQPKRVLIDLSKLDYISSAGIGVLFQFQKEVQSRGGILTLFNPQTQIRSILEAVRAFPLKNIFYDESDADELLKMLQEMGKTYPEENDGPNSLLS
ncbi:MAG: STAS domain-containing protein [Candidatus Omnitrophica bacterium]|nr:STAS domain-containing protein [Candidatus Omnitrophota bacterium]